MNIIIKGRKFTFSQFFYCSLYYLIAKHLPYSKHFLLGAFSKKLRYLCGRKLFYKCGKNVNIEHGANFASGQFIEIGDNSGIGINCYIPKNTIIGSNVMMGPNVYILEHNHKFDRIDIPMNQQGFSENKKTIIEDDVWIGRDVIMTPGRTIRKGSIIAAGTVLCKDFPPYSIIGGNPSRLIRTRNSTIQNNL